MWIANAQIAIEYQISIVPRGAKKEDKIKVLPGLSVYGPRPKRPIILYDIESSGECRAVREAATGSYGSS